MRSLVEKLRATLRDAVEGSKIKVEFGLPPKVQFEWDGKTVNSMYKTSHVVSYHLVMSFADRPVFFEDLGRIASMNPVKMLRDAEDAFNHAAKEILAQADPGRMHLAGLFHSCIPIIADCRRQLEGAPGPESLKVAIQSEVPEMRSKIVPRMEVLASFLPSNDIGGGELIRRIASARQSMTPEQQLASQPHLYLNK